MYSNGQKSQPRRGNNTGSGTPSNTPTHPANNNEGGGPRHVACKTCRDRKVRCDGGQPACEKCQRAGEVCIYTPGAKKTRTDLVETVEMLQERLARAESALEVRDTTARNGSYRPSSSASSSFLPVSDLATTWPCQPQPASSPLQSMSNSNYMVSQRPLQAPDLSMIHSGAMSFITDAPIDPNTNLTISSDDSMLANMSGSTAMTDPPHSYTPFTACVMKDQSHWPNPEQRRDQDALPITHLPSRRDVRKWNAAQQDQQQPSNNARPITSVQADIWTHFATFAKTVGAMNADIAGVALTQADYLAWVRKKPDECHDGLLAIFEARSRETADMAASKMAAAVEEATASFVNISGLEDHVNLIRVDTARIHQEKVDFFHSRYEIQRSLAEQCEN